VCTYHQITCACSSSIEAISLAQAGRRVELQLQMSNEIKNIVTYKTIHIYLYLSIRGRTYIHSHQYQTFLQIEIQLDDYHQLIPY